MNFVLREVSDGGSGRRRFVVREFRDLFTDEFFVLSGCVIEIERAFLMCAAHSAIIGGIFFQSLTRLIIELSSVQSASMISATV